MLNPNRTSKYGNRDLEDSRAPSCNLWVGNLPVDVTDNDLMVLFADYRALDSLISNSSRTFAFMLFKRVDDAIAAKEALQGVNLRGSSIKIMFAKPLLRNTVIPEAPMFKPEFPPQDPELGVTVGDEDGHPEDRVEVALTCLPPHKPASC